MEFPRRASGSPPRTAGGWPSVRRTRRPTRQGGALEFDFAVDEECQVYDECDSYISAYGAEVIEIEYTDNGIAAFTDACRARGRRISDLRREHQVVPAGGPGYVERNCA